VGATESTGPHRIIVTCQGTTSLSQHKPEARILAARPATRNHDCRLAVNTLQQACALSRGARKTALDKIHKHSLSLIICPGFIPAALHASDRSLAAGVK
jgi:hypothetical protein